MESSTIAENHAGYGRLVVIESRFRDHDLGTRIFRRSQRWPARRVKRGEVIGYHRHQRPLTAAARALRSSK